MGRQQVSRPELDRNQDSQTFPTLLSRGCAQGVSKCLSIKLRERGMEVAFRHQVTEQNCPESPGAGICFNMNKAIQRSGSSACLRQMVFSGA
eukprot:4651858-Amphidinium_carterae.1